MIITDNYGLWLDLCRTDDNTLHSASFDQCLDENDVVPTDRRHEIKYLLRREKYLKLVIRTNIKPI